MTESDNTFRWALGIGRYKWLFSEKEGAGKSAGKIIKPKTATKPKKITLNEVRLIAQECTKCSLHKNRIKSVFGFGDLKADIMFVGEAPGEEENKTGIPFVGKAGQILTGMMLAIGLRREDVYICNTVKCRPPNNRKPSADEMHECFEYLGHQMSIVQPRLIVCLGLTAAKALLRLKDGTPVSSLRESTHLYKGKTHNCNLIVTYHPSYLLRKPSEKQKAWADLKRIKEEAHPSS